MMMRRPLAATLAVAGLAAAAARAEAQGFATGGGPSFGAWGSGYGATFAWNFESGHHVRLGIDVGVQAEGSHRVFAVSLLVGHRMITHRDFVPYVSAGLANATFHVFRSGDGEFQTGDISKTTPTAVVGIDLGRRKLRLALEVAYAPTVVVPTQIFRGLRATPQDERVGQLTARVLLVFGKREE
jgi:hypothetical protein